MDGSFFSIFEGNMDFKGTIARYIKSNHLINEGSRVLLGISGGADSVALLRVLLELGYNPVCVHCNFHLRGEESDRDQAFVEQLCSKFSLDLEICHYDTRQYASDHSVSIEMAARELRYRDFERLMSVKGATAICIAHHKDDSVETILMNLMRGTGIKGLTGIKPVNGNIVRPLLCVSRADILDYLRSLNQDYITDSTNLEPDCTRNRIRLQLLPLMRQICSDTDNSIMETASHLQQAWDIYSAGIDRLTDSTVHTENGITYISINALRNSPSVQGLLFEILSPMGFNDSQIANICASLDSQPGTQFLSATHILVKDRDSLIVAPACRNPEPLTLTLEPGTSVSLPGGQVMSISTAPNGTPVSRQATTATIDLSKINGPVTVRPVQPGDWFIPFGMKGRKLVSDFLTDSKCSLIERQRQLVLAQGDNIIWVIGRRTDNRYRITPDTAQQLILTIS